VAGRELSAAEVEKLLSEIAALAARSGDGS
jgi:hypothetical protein